MVGNNNKGFGGQPDSDTPSHLSVSFFNHSIFIYIKGKQEVVIISKGAGERRAGNPRSEKERAARHFDKSVEEVTEEDIEKLPKRGSGLDE